MEPAGTKAGSTGGTGDSDDARGAVAFRVTAGGSIPVWGAMMESAGTENEGWDNPARGGTREPAGT
jgi:hypothetical protein